MKRIRGNIVIWISGFILVFIATMGLSFMAGFSIRPPVQVVVQTEYIEVPIEKEIVREIPLNLREFNSREELTEWVINNLPAYNKAWVCVDYALALQKTALQQGWLMSTEYKEQFGLPYLAIYSTVIGDEIYFVDPKTGGVELKGLKGNGIE